MGRQRGAEVLPEPRGDAPGEQGGAADLEEVGGGLHMLLCYDVMYATMTYHKLS